MTPERMVFHPGDFVVGDWVRVSMSKGWGFVTHVSPNGPLTVEWQDDGTTSDIEPRTVFQRSRAMIESSERL